MLLTQLISNYNGNIRIYLLCIIYYQFCASVTLHSCQTDAFEFPFLIPHCKWVTRFFSKYLYSPGKAFHRQWIN